MIATPIVNICNLNSKEWAKEPLKLSSILWGDHWRDAESLRRKRSSEITRILRWIQPFQRQQRRLCGSCKQNKNNFARYSNICRALIWYFLRLLGFFVSQKHNHYVSTTKHSFFRDLAKTFAETYFLYPIRSSISGLEGYNFASFLSRQCSQHGSKRFFSGKPLEEQK